MELPFYKFYFIKSAWIEEGDSNFATFIGNKT